MASVGFNITLDPAQYANARAMLDPVQYTIAMQAAISDTVRTGKARLARIVGTKLNMSIGNIKERIKDKKSSYAKLEGTISVSRKPVKLSEYRTSQTKRGATVKPWKDRPRQKLSSTFHASMKSGHRGVFERARLIEFGGLSGDEQLSYRAGMLHFKKSKLVRQKFGGNRVGRLPVMERYGPTVVGAITGNKKREGVEEEIEIDLRDVLAKNLNSQINRVLNNPKSIAGLIPKAQRAINSR